MQEFTVQYNHFTSGILEQNPTINAGGLEDCFGLKPHEGRLVEPLKLLNPKALAPGYPFPQLFCGSGICWLEEDKIQKLDNDFEVVSELAVTAGLTWHAIDFGQYVLFTNGVSIVELRDDGTLALNTTLPRFSTA